MGMSVKVPPPPPPPPAPKDESDAAPTAMLMQQRALGQLGYKRNFLSGLRGPGGADLATSMQALVPDATGTSAPSSVPVNPDGTPWSRGQPLPIPQNRVDPAGGSGTSTTQAPPPRPPKTTDNQPPTRQRYPIPPPRKGGH